jgi:glutaredoxin 3
MPQIIVYSKQSCPYCRRAKALLTQKGAAFEEIDIIEQPEQRARMIELAGGRTTVPQIFINGRHIGGCDDLVELNLDGGLDPLLKA